MSAVDKRLKELNAAITHALYSKFSTYTYCHQACENVESASIYIAEVTCEACIEAIAERIKNPR